MTCGWCGVRLPGDRSNADTRGFAGRSNTDNALTAVTSAAAAVTDRQVVLTTTKDHGGFSRSQGGTPAAASASMQQCMRVVISNMPVAQAFRACTARISPLLSPGSGRS